MYFLEFLTIIHNNIVKMRIKYIDSGTNFSKITLHIIGGTSIHRNQVLVNRIKSNDE